MPEPLFQRVALIGFGLIGSSIARACRARDDMAGTIVASARSAETLATVARLGIADVIEADPGRAVADADLVILCTPVGVLAEVTAAIAPHLKPGAVLSDVGSTKGSVIRDMAPHVPKGVHFVPAHPIAGTEFSGPEAGFAELFQGRWCIVTPLPDTDPQAVTRLEEFWRRTGSMVASMDPASHDRVLAVVSHLPHLIAFTIVNTADHLEQEMKEKVLDFAASGFRDFTRIAASDPVMWRDVFLNNREALLEMLARFTEDVQAMARAVRRGEAEYIEDSIRRGRKLRRALIEKKQA